MWVGAHWSRRTNSEVGVESGLVLTHRKVDHKRRSKQRITHKPLKAAAQLLPHHSR